MTELARIASALMESSGGSPAALPAAVATTELDVRFATIGPLAMTNSVARVELLPELQLSGTIGRPALKGQIAAVDDGRINVGGRQYRSATAGSSSARIADWCRDSTSPETRASATTSCICT